ncbi:hypothetical protein [Bacteroides eggerthii]|uniref:hypothetical protein n=1 Tax=Bacteroides eggerthii TaxID=28111 RepID=UPI00293D8046|nr:hypothetical protein [Bacteroides eggerthii]
MTSSGGMSGNVNAASEWPVPRSVSADCEAHPANNGRSNNSNSTTAANQRSARGVRERRG